VEAPPHAEVRADGGAVAFLERVLLVQRHWVLAGEAPDPRSPGLHHNVSHTCPVHGDEWPAVADFIWHHRGEFSGVALLADEAITHYPDAPLHVVTPDDRERWNQLVCRPVDYYVPLDETTRDAGEAERCTPGACDPS
jgi:ribonucleoside-diphosphate reductase alpha chain